MPVTALARGREPPVQFAPPGLHLALALAHLPALRTPLDPAPLIVVGRVVGSPLPIELAVQPPQRSGIGRYLGAERLEQRGHAARPPRWSRVVRSSPTIPRPRRCCGFWYGTPWHTNWAEKRLRSPSLRRT